jgi:alkanesulfonate monooxygenase SsuD/methylene tetrahydromethanopterin reductase-like flavin-dependent oxidoreductase (luciferase family)
MMDIGIGLPTTIPGASRSDLLEWARRADAAGFSTLGTIDRIVYANYDPLVAYGAAAAVTERIRLTTAITILPYRVNAALVAKQAASIQKLSGGRLVFGVAVGGREDDYAASGVPMEGRGKRFEEMLDTIRRVWAGEDFGVAGGIGPDVSDDPPTLLVGGQVDAAFRRAAEYGDGWIMGGGPAEVFASAAEKLEAAWREAGREGEPRKKALSYFSLDDDPEAQVRSTIGDYYAFLGDYAEQIVAGAAKGEDAVRERVQAFEAAGADELILFPASSNPEQVDRLAAVTNVMAR